MSDIAYSVREDDGTWTHVIKKPGATWFLALPSDGRGYVRVPAYTIEEARAEIEEMNDQIAAECRSPLLGPVRFTLASDLA